MSKHKHQQKRDIGHAPEEVEALQERRKHLIEERHELAEQIIHAPIGTSPTSAAPESAKAPQTTSAPLNTTTAPLDAKESKIRKEAYEKAAFSSGVAPENVSPKLAAQNSSPNVSSASGTSRMMTPPYLTSSADMFGLQADKAIEEYAYRLFALHMEMSQMAFAMWLDMISGFNTSIAHRSTEAA